LSTPIQEAQVRSTSGFTLIELMVAMVILSILTAIAVPSYVRYAQRGDLVEATQGLSQYRVQMEQYYQDNGNYGTGGACGVAAPTGLVNFTLTCNLASAQSYTATMTGNAGGQVAGFVYTINQSNTQQTTGLPSSWGALTSAASTSWIVR
jgi:type IV pilus assembly protein PilE